MSVVFLLYLGRKCEKKDDNERVMNKLSTLFSIIGFSTCVSVPVVSIAATPMNLPKTCLSERPFQTTPCALQPNADGNYLYYPESHTDSEHCTISNLGAPTQIYFDSGYSGSGPYLGPTEITVHNGDTLNLYYAGSINNNIGPYYFTVTCK